MKLYTSFVQHDAITRQEPHPLKCLGIALDLDLDLDFFFYSFINTHDDIHILCARLFVFMIMDLSYIHIYK